MADSKLLELEAPEDNMVYRVRVVVYNRVDSDAVAARRLAGLIAELAELDPIWTGPWSTRLMKQDERVPVSPDPAGFEELFTIARADGDWTSISDQVYFVISTPYGASIGAEPFLTVPEGAPQRSVSSVTQLSFDIRPKDQALAEAGLDSRATSGAIGLALFEAVQRWLEPDAFFYIPLQADKITSAVAELIRPLRTFRMIDKATSARFSKLPIGWLNLFATDVNLETNHLPACAVITTDPRTGATIVRLGDSPWTVTDDDYHALRAAVGLPRPDKILDTRSMTSAERRALKPPYW
ncbi:hypothetical protein [Nocardia sp. IFM 10818]